MHASAPSLPCSPSTPHSLARIEWGRVWDGGWSPSCHDALSLLLHLPTSVECLAGYSLAEWPMGPFVLHGGKCFIWLFHSWVEQNMERYTNCQRPRFWELSERQLPSELVVQSGILSCSSFPWHPTPSHSTSALAQGRLLYSDYFRIMQSRKQKTESAKGKWLTPGMEISLAGGSWKRIDIGQAQSMVLQVFQWKGLQ